MTLVDAKALRDEIKAARESVEKMVERCSTEMYPGAVGRMVSPGWVLDIQASIESLARCAERLVEEAERAR